ncbi:MAG: hypothetical protein PHE77_03215 [Candidatus Pacebacteria bacterium]|nr:hypothetical protein [Candidatus Paceibacterota bacterium]
MDNVERGKKYKSTKMKWENPTLRRLSLSRRQKAILGIEKMLKDGLKDDIEETKQWAVNRVDT